MTVHLLPKSHGLFTNMSAIIVLVATRRRHSSPRLLPAHHVLIELYVRKLLRVSVLLHIVSTTISAAVVSMSVNVG